VLSYQMFAEPTASMTILYQAFCRRDRGVFGYLLRSRAPCLLRSSS
jgi:hypothetical protein